jgi:hypothetical protein
MKNNPFAVVSPEEMTAADANQLFVESHSDFPEIRRPGNTLITGARGCGKSMLIRCSMPDVLMLKDNKKLNELDILSFRVPVKRTSLNLTELRTLDEKHAPYLLNEHFLSLYVVMNVFHQLSELDIPEFSQNGYVSFITNLNRYLRLSGSKTEIIPDYSSSKVFFNKIYEFFEELSYEFISYLLRLTINLSNTDYNYSQPLLSFIRFIYPVFKQMLSLPGLPQTEGVFIFIDDADNLSEIQTKILNSWLICRTQPVISLKISTQVGQYKSYLSSSDVLVESPHDYQEINISVKYTTDTVTTGKSYHDFAVDIIEKRLKLFEINKSAEEFLPVYPKQAEGIKKERENIEKEYQDDEQAALKKYHCKMDDALSRFAIPNYIRSLSGYSKSGMTYRYAGLDNIVHLSSGIIRYLLDALSKMYDIQINNINGSDAKIDSIDTKIQNDVMRNQADNLMFNELKKFNSSSNGLEPIENATLPADKLQNLIAAMGKTFSDVLLSDRAERKVFSIALTNVPTEELKEVFSLGVRLGFFHEMRIGNKQGNGKVTIYVLNRCFAPLFKLDPSGFQGYLWMKNEDLTLALKNGKQLRSISKEKEDDCQLSFFDLEE